MILDELCPPAILYIVFTITHIIIDIFKKLYNLAFIKFVVMIIFTLLLNILCSQGLTIVSWLIVFLPFIFMTIITSLMLYTFELSPSKGKLDYKVDYPDRDKHKHRRREHDNNEKKHHRQHDNNERNRDPDYSSDSESESDEPRPYNNKGYNRDQPSKHNRAYPDSDSENILPTHVDKHNHHNHNHHKHNHHKHNHHNHNHHNDNNTQNSHGGKGKGKGKGNGGGRGGGHGGGGRGAGHGGGGRGGGHGGGGHGGGGRGGGRGGGGVHNTKDGICKQIKNRRVCKSVGKSCSTKDTSCIINNKMYTGCQDCGFQPDCECAKV